MQSREELELELTEAKELSILAGASDKINNPSSRKVDRISKILDIMDYTDFYKYKNGVGCINKIEMTGDEIPLTNVRLSEKGYFKDLY